MRSYRREEEEELGSFACVRVRACEGEKNECVSDEGLLCNALDARFSSSATHEITQMPLSYFHSLSVMAFAVGVITQLL